MEEIKKTNNRNFEVRHLKIALDTQDRVMSDYIIKELEITFKENMHIELNIELAVKKLKEWKGEIKSYPLDIYIYLIFNGMIFFNGIIHEISSGTFQSDGYKVKIKAYSKSEILDRKKYYRVYQDQTLTYYDIIMETLNKEEYKKHNIQLTGYGFYVLTNPFVRKKINNILIQYDETDWEFLIRITSHVGGAILNSKNGSILLGNKYSADATVQLQAVEKIQREIEKQLFLEPQESISYVITTNEFFFSEEIIIDRNAINLGIVTRGKIEYRDGKFSGRYELMSMNHTYQRLYNLKIKGASIEAKVVKIPYPKTLPSKNIAELSVDFSLGMEKIVSSKLKNKEIYFAKPDFKTQKKNEDYYFPYFTPYSKTKTGFFCTPEPDDIVAVYFPTENENDGYVDWAINNKNSIRFSNQFKRNFFSKRGADFLEDKNGTVFFYDEGVNYFGFDLDNDNFKVEIYEKNHEIFHKKTTKIRKWENESGYLDINIEGNILTEIDEKDELKVVNQFIDTELEHEEIVNDKKEYFIKNENKRIEEDKSVFTENFKLSTGKYNVGTLQKGIKKP